MRRAFAAIVCAIAFGSFAATLRFPQLFGSVITLVGFGLPFLSFAVVGSLLVVRRAGDPIGWLLGAAGALLPLSLLAQAYGFASLQAGAGLPGGELGLWFGSPGSLVALGLIVSALVRFPDGRPPGRAFAMLLCAFVAFLAIGVIGVAFADRPIEVPNGGPPPLIPNPFALHGPLGDLLWLAASAKNIIVALLLIAPGALVVRFRRSRGVERQQLKWLTYTAAITFGLSLVAVVSPPGTMRVLAEAAASFGTALLPVAIGIAVTRYRLYDIDVLIRRTLIYGAVSALLVVTYLGGVALLQLILSPLTSGSPIAVAVSTLAVVALFQPVRMRIGAAVDRRFYRSKYDAERTLDAFAVQLRDEVDLDALRADLLEAVGQTVQPARASLWLRGRAR